MWNNAAFAHFGLALIIVGWAGANHSYSVRKVALAALSIWLLSWAAMVGWLVVLNGSSHSRFVFQRDLGYFLGGLTFTFPLFLAVFLVGLMLRRTSIRFSSKLIVSFCAAGVAWLFTPSLVAVGSIMGCVITGYSECL